MSFRTTKQRSRNMRAIRGASNATTELRLRAHLVRNGIAGWRVREKVVPGRPDFYFPRKRIAVFVDGCFWHGCPKCGHTPKANRGYWIEKLAHNKLRDAQVGRLLRSKGIRVLRLWECQLRDRPEVYLKKLAACLAT
jgi:DNA mismatch endonuclease (patch repair protein)